MTIKSLEAEKQPNKWQRFWDTDWKMNLEQKANFKFCFKCGKIFTETLNVMKIVYDANFLSRTSVWVVQTISRRSWGRNTQQLSQSKHTAMRERRRERHQLSGSIFIHAFIKKSSLRYMEMELNTSMPKNSIHRVLIEHLGLRKVYERFVPHKLTDD